MTRGSLAAARVDGGDECLGGHADDGVLRTPADCAAIIVGPPKSGKTRKVIAPTLARWAGPALVTSTKGDILATPAHRSRHGPVAVYDPTGSLGHPEASVGFSPLSRCGHGTVRSRSPPRCCRRPRRMRRFATVSISRSPRVRCSRRCFTPPRYRAAGSTCAWMAWPLGVLPARGDPARGGRARSRLRSYPASPRRPSGTTAPRCSGLHRSRSRGPRGQRSGKQRPRRSHHRSTLAS